MTRRPPAERAFAAFVERLRPSPDEIAAARTAATTAAAALRRHFRPGAAVQGREDHLVAGSFGKRTAVRPLPPIDLYYLLPEPPAAPPPPCGAVLRETATALDGLWDSAAVADGWRIAIAAPGCVVAAVPCLAHRGAFLIPGEAGWRLSNPAAEAAALRLGDGLSGGRLSDLLALAKAWRAAAAAALPTFALEILAREFAAAAATEAPLPALLADFLVWIRRHTPAEFELPGGLGRLAVGDAWHGQAEAAYWRCVLAQRHAGAGEHAEAAAEWRKVLGPLYSDFDTTEGDR